jgi:hypothetical protein
MGQTFGLGRISGIRIGVNWSVLVIVALLAYGLAAGQFPAAAPRRPVAEYIAAAVVTAVAYSRHPGGDGCGGCAAGRVVRCIGGCSAECTVRRDRSRAGVSAHTVGRLRAARR